MGEKLSQSEVDALVARLLAGEASAEAAPVAESAPKTEESQPAAPAAFVDLGPITQAEVDALMLTASSYAASTTAPAAAVMAPVTVPSEPPVDLGPITQDELDSAPVLKSPAAPAPVAAPPVQPTAAPVAVPPVQAAPAPAAAVPFQPAAAAALIAPSPVPAAKPLSPRASNILMGIDLTLTIELGRTRMRLSDLLVLGPGSVIVLDRLANEAVDITVNGIPIMECDVVTIGENYGLKVTKSKLNGQKAS